MLINELFRWGTTVAEADWPEGRSFVRRNENAPGIGQKESIYWEKGDLSMQIKRWLDPDGKEATNGTLQIRAGKKPLYCNFDGYFTIYFEWLWNYCILLEFALLVIFGLILSERSIENWNECLKSIHNVIMVQNKILFRDVYFFHNYSPRRKKQETIIFDVMGGGY